MQYKIMELGLNQELAAIHMTQIEIESMKEGGAEEAPAAEASEKHEEE